MSSLLKAFCFKNGKLINASVVNARQKENVLESFRQTLNQENTLGLSVVFYDNEVISNKSEGLIKINIDSIDVQGERFLKEEVKVNWVSEVNLSAFYSLEECELVNENIQAMINFVPLASNAEFSGKLEGMESDILLESERQENFSIVFDGVKSVADILSENTDISLISGESSQVPNENEEMVFTSQKSEFSFPHQVEEKFKEIDTDIKERYTIETIYPVETIEGVSND